MALISILLKIVLILSACLIYATHSYVTENEYFDLGYSINEDTIYYPGAKDFQLTKDKLGKTPKGYWYASFSFCMGEHGGTHLDAPFHFSEKGITLDQIPSSKLIDVPARMVDVKDDVFKMSSPDKFLLKVEHLISHEEKFGQIPNGALIFIRTGWSQYWPDKIRYLGWDNSTAPQFSLNFPGISLNAVKWLSTERDIIGIGIDTASVDAGSSQEKSVHIHLGDKQLYGIENLANLHLLANKTRNCLRSLYAFVLPMKIVGGTGAPTRILAYCKQN